MTDDFPERGASDARSVCVFCGARVGADPRFAAGARRVGEAIARQRWRLVFGGGHVGLMGATADAALAAGGEVIGVIPRSMVRRELAHQGLTRLEIVEGMGPRKERMIELSDAFLVLPGGLGTLDELFEVLTLRQIRQHAKPTAILNQDGYYDLLLAALRGFVGQGLVGPADVEQLIVGDDVGDLLARLELAVG